MGQTYSEVDSFETLPGLAEVDFFEVNDILRSSATGAGDIIGLNDDSARSVGIVWSTRRVSIPCMQIGFLFLELRQ
jgi:hypothetical protein